MLFRSCFSRPRKVAASGGVIDRALDGVLDNLGRLAAYAGSFAAFLAGRWVFLRLSPHFEDFV